MTENVNSAELVSEAVGDASTPNDKLKIAFDRLAQCGEEFVKHEATATRRKAKSFGVLVLIFVELKEEGLLDDAMADLRRMIGSSNGVGSLGQHKGQSFYFLAMRAYFKIPDATASRYASLIKWLQKNKISPEDFGEEIEQRDGLEECIKQAKSAEKPSRVKSILELSDDGDLMDDRPWLGSRGDDDDPSSDETRDDDNRSDATESSDEDLFLKVSPKVSKPFEALEPGHYAFAGVVRVNQTNRKIVMITRDPDACNPMIKALKGKNLEHCYGLDLGKLEGKKIRVGK